MDQLEKYVDHKSYIYLRHIHRFLAVIMKNHKNAFYQLDRPSTCSKDKQPDTNSSRTFDDPYFEIFIWSIMASKPNLGQFFWSKTRHPLVSAIFAATFYGTLYHDMYKLR